VYFLTIYFPNPSGDSKEKRVFCWTQNSAFWGRQNKSNEWIPKIFELQQMCDKWEERRLWPSEINFLVAVLRGAILLKETAVDIRVVTEGENSDVLAW